MDIDLTGAEAFDLTEKEFELLPTARYLLQVDEAEIKEKSAGDFLTLRWNVLEGKYANRKIFMDYPIRLNNPNDDWIMTTKSKLKTILEIGGRNNPNATSCKAETFMGIQVEGYVVQEDKDGKYPKNKVQRYHKSAQRISADDMQKRIDEAQANATPVNRVTL